jgi:hypothetical protein
MKFAGTKFDYAAVKSVLTNSDGAPIGGGQAACHPFQHLESYRLGTEKRLCPSVDEREIPGLRKRGYLQKSRVENWDTLIKIIVELLNSPGGQEMLQVLDGHAPDGCVREKLPVKGSFRGYAIGSDIPARISTMTLYLDEIKNQLYIRTAFPDGLQTDGSETLPRTLKIVRPFGKQS